ncbi:nuclear body protein SP140-like protein [Hemibagrus wyckioides]|uniref:nuclear body protein SP140-like protein n=1 Tax=Hemibagrus wyckioides TaxID=337641 RepID=UPI00266D64A8|nr:nuclear body protein SP140-like protein [Hemibagrus wyckioides]
MAAWTRVTGKKRTRQFGVTMGSGILVCQRVGKSLKKKLKFPVTCGSKEGILHKDRYKRGEPCILSDGQWFTPNDFEKFGGKEKNKKWKISIMYSQVPLLTFIQEGFLSSPSFKIKRLQDQEPECGKKLIRTRSNTKHEKNSVVSTVMPEEDSLVIKRVFRGDTFEVSCFRGQGVLHVSRFATETCGKCIRTQDAWLTPKDFLNQNKAEGHWRLDITSRSYSLGKLIMSRVLEPHMVNCKCPICTEDPLHLLDQKNDDVCFKCKHDGDLVCCEKCPRSFHHHCHKPVLEDDMIGDHWTCCYCKAVTAKRNRSS